MFILEKPYISDFLKETLAKNSFPVLKNSYSGEFLPKNLTYFDENSVISYCKQTKVPLIYSNSENALEWICKNLAMTDIPRKISLFKDKIKFRKILADTYKDFYFREIDFGEIKNINPRNLKFPLVLKPAIGFLSFGVYMIYSMNDWISVVKTLEEDISKFKSIYPMDVVNTSKFIIEDMIQGQEYAIDAYFNSEGKPVILNIFKHPFSSGRDVSDRVYFTSKEIIEKYLDKFTTVLNKIGDAVNLKNFPVHIEVRVDGDKVIPIEVNPMRFAGWCMTDIAYYAWGINVYESYINQLIPNWDSILANSDDNIYYVMFADVSKNIKNANIASVDYDGLISNFNKPIEIRKIDYNIHPIYAIIFAKTSCEKEIDDILKLDVYKYINVSVN